MVASIMPGAVHDLVEVFGKVDIVVEVGIMGHGGGDAGIDSESERLLEVLAKRADSVAELEPLEQVAS